MFAGYKQFVVVQINAPSGTALNIRSAHLDWGKFRQEGNKDAEINAGTINMIVIPAGESVTISASGADGAAAGTEGSFDLFDGDTKVGTYSWDCPYVSPTNRSPWQPSGRKYVVQQSGANLSGGGIGTVTLDVAKRKKAVVPSAREGSSAGVPSATQRPPLASLPSRTTRNDLLEVLVQEGPPAHLIPVSHFP